MAQSCSPGARRREGPGELAEVEAEASRDGSGACDPKHDFPWPLGKRGHTSEPHPLLGTRCLRPGLQGCSRQGEENRWVRAAGPTSAPTRTKTSCSPQPEVVCLQTAVSALATVLRLPGQQRLSVCLPRPPPRLHLWPPPGPTVCANPPDLHSGSPQMQCQQTTPDRWNGQWQFRRKRRSGDIQLWGEPTAGEVFGHIPEA